MTRAPRGRRGFPIVAGLLVAAFACSVQAKTARHLERGDGYFDQKKYREAILEYRSVLDKDPKNTRAVQRLGIAHYELGELGQSYGYLRRASETDPNDVEVRWRLGALAVLSRQMEEARRHATFVLQKAPDSVEGLALMADTAETREEVEVAVRRISEARERLPERERLGRVLGLLYLKKGDLPKAEEAFRDAVKSAPQSVDAHSALATLYSARGQAVEAEKEFRAAADAAPPASPARLRLADFYLARGRRDDAKKVLTTITAQSPDYAPAWLRLADTALAEQKYDEAEKAVQAVLQKNPRHQEALLLAAQSRLQQGKTDEALQQIQTALKYDPKFPPAHYQLALAHLQAGNEQQARAALKQAITLAPGYAEAALRLAELDVQGGGPDAAIDDLDKLLKERPGIPRAYELLGAAYLKKGDPARALEAYGKFQQLMPPTDPRAAYYAGLALRAQGRRAEARKAFESAMAVAPGSAEPLTQLVEMAFEDHQPDLALAIARKQAQASPRSAAVQAVLGRVFQRRGELSDAEAAHHRAVELDPRLASGHLEMSRLYAATGRLDQALAETEKALQIDPKSAETWLVYGQLQQQKGDMGKAQNAFKKALDLDPRSAPAANNLAWVYSEHGGNADEALRFAQLAKQLAPDDPHVSDTLGWLLYKRAIYQQALNLLKESAAKLPDNAQTQYHLGMTYYKLGDKPAARQALSRALQLNGSFDGSDEARRVLAEL